jgi:hypothetical protein
VPCPHTDALLVGGRCYWCCKLAALNGSRSKLSVEQLEFVGCVSEVAPDTGLTSRPDAGRWLQPPNPTNIDQQLDELARLRDLAPNWYALARKIVEKRKRNRDGGYPTGTSTEQDLRQPASDRFPPTKNLSTKTPHKRRG